MDERRKPQFGCLAAWAIFTAGAVFAYAFFRSDNLSAEFFCNLIAGGCLGFFVRGLVLCLAQRHAGSRYFAGIVFTVLTALGILYVVASAKGWFWDTWDRYSIVDRVLMGATFQALPFTVCMWRGFAAAILR